MPGTGDVNTRSFLLGMSAAQGTAEPGTLLQQLVANVTRIKGLVQV